eukprot:2945877-Rhodomonas_salina.1
MHPRTGCTQVDANSWLMLPCRWGPLRLCFSGWSWRRAHSDWAAPGLEEAILANAPTSPELPTAAGSIRRYQASMASNKCEPRSASSSPPKLPNFQLPKPAQQSVASAGGVGFRASRNAVDPVGLRARLLHQIRGAG